MPDDFWHGPQHQLKGFVNAATAVVLHSTIGALILLSVWGMGELIHLLWKDEDPLFFGQVRLHTVIQTAEIGVLVAYAFWGTISTFRAFKE